MRKYAYIKDPNKCKRDTIYKIIIYESEGRVHLFEYTSLMALRCSYDEIYESIEAIYEEWNDLIDERGWIEIEDPSPDSPADAFLFSQRNTIKKSYISPEAKKTCQKIFIKNFPGYKWKMLFAYFFFLVAVIAFLTMPVMYITSMEQIDLEELLELLAGSAIIGLVPFIIGILIKDRIFKDLLWNTVNIESESVEVTDDSIIHTWHKKGTHSEEMLEYIIHHDYIESVHLFKDSKMLTIVGSATITPYENYANKQINSKYPAYTTSNSNIEQFFIALDDRNEESEILKLIKAVSEEKFSET